MIQLILSAVKSSLGNNMEASKARQIIPIPYRIVVDSAFIIAGAAALIAWGSLSTTVTVQAKDISQLQAENRTLSTALVDTQKEIIRRLTRIETTIRMDQHD